MSARPAVPRLAAWLAGISVPPADREALLGDLEERFVQRVEGRGERPARRWYRGQALRIVLVLGPRRLLHALGRLSAPGTARAAARSLVRSPGTSLAAAVTLAVGIAAPVAMFALADGITSSLPRDPDDRMVRVSRLDREGRIHFGAPWSLVEAWRDGATGPGDAFAGLAAFRSGGPVAVGDGEVPAGRDRGVYATPDLFALLGVAPVAGRLYGGEEEAGLPAVLIREDLWEERFDRDPAAMGRVLRIDGVDHVVVGVLPADFGFPIDHRLWMQPSRYEGETWSVAGRLATGASAAVARQQLAAVDAAVLRDGEEAELAMQVERYTEAHFSSGREHEQTRRVGLVSLILVVLTAVNVAAVMVARGVSRSCETAVRRALGASRRQVMALTLTEALFLAVGGGALGLALGHGGVRVMVRYLTGQATIVPYWMDFDLGMRSLVLAALLALLALVVAGLFPALRSSGTDLDGPLRVRPHGGPGAAGRVMTVVVGLEVALSSFLLAVSGVVVEEALSRIRTGADFPTAGVVTGHFVLESPGYSDADERRAFFSVVLDALRADPVVHSASLVSHLPGKEGAVLGAGPADPAEAPSELPPAQVRSTDPELFGVLGIQASAGRLFTGADDDRGEAVAVVNEAFARRHGLGRDAVGRQIVVDRLARGEPYEARVVGVVDDLGITPHAAGRPTPGVYLPLAQMPSAGAYLLVHTLDSASLPRVWHRAVARLDPYLPIGAVLTLEETLRRGHGAATLFGSVFLTLGAVTLLIALVGLHGVHTFSLARRVREMGVRRALGAGSTRILRESMARGLRPVWAGLLVGVVPGLLAAEAVVPVDPSALTWLLPPALLLATSVLAVWRPTRRASRADPAQVLRED